MQFNTTTEYSIRIILYLAIRKEVTASIQISRDLGIPVKYLINIGSKLKHGKLINTHRGKKGGYSLAKSPEAIRIYDILVVTEQTIKINRCLEADGYCSIDASKGCQIRRFYSIAQKKMEAYFKTITIADLMADVDEYFLLAAFERKEKVIPIKNSPPHSPKIALAAAGNLKEL